MSGDAVVVPLHEIAHGRAGDKGNRSNISVIAYVPEAYPFILEQVTAERVHGLFAHRGATAVVRYELPKLAAINLVIDDVLEGGVNGSLNLDGHGKTLSFHVLALPVEVPDDLLELSREARSRADD
jgi:hypothetical protein